MELYIKHRAFALQYRAPLPERGMHGALPNSAQGRLTLPRASNSALEGIVLNLRHRALNKQPHSPREAPKATQGQPCISGMNLYAKSTKKYLQGIFELKNTDIFPRYRLQKDQDLPSYSIELSPTNTSSHPLPKSYRTLSQDILELLPQDTELCPWARSNSAQSTIELYSGQNQTQPQDIIELYSRHHRTLPKASIVLTPRNHQKPDFQAKIDVCLPLCPEM